MKNKKIIIIIASAVLIFVSIFVIVKLVLKSKTSSQNNKPGSVLVENEDLLKDQKIGNLTVTNVILDKENNKSKYAATVTNNSSKDETVNLAIIFHEENMKTEIIPLNNKIIKAKQKTNIEIIFEIDLSKIKKIEYTLK